MIRCLLHKCRTCHKQGCRACPRHREYPQADIAGKSINPNPIPHSLGEAVDEALERLSPEDRETLRLHFWERMSYAEMSRETGLAGKQGSHERTKAALERLRRELERDDIDYK
jgi:DNA-directed RNA polymerase specialized sigma24 family protein